MTSSSPVQYVPALRVGSYGSSPVGTPPLYFATDHFRQPPKRPRHIQHNSEIDRGLPREHAPVAPGDQDRLINDEIIPSDDVTPRGWSAREIITLTILMAGNISGAMFGSLLAPFFPTEAVKKGATLYEVGLIFGCFQLISFIMSPLFGRNMTKLGAKYLFISGNFLCSGCAILFGVLEWCPDGVVYVVMCFVCRSVEAVGSAAQNTATFTIGAYTFPHRISTIMGLLQASSCIGLVAGPPIGGFLFSKGGYFLPFAVTGSLVMFFSFVSIFFLPSPKEEVQRRIDNTGSMLKLLRIPIVPIVGYMVLVGQATIGFVDVALAAYLNVVKPDMSTIFVGLIFLIPAGLVVITAPIFGFITDKHEKLGRPFMVFGAFIGGLGFLGIGPSPLLTFLPSATVWSVVISLVVSAVGWGCLVVTYQQFITAARQHGFQDGMETQGIISGINGAFNSLGALLGPTIGGVLYEQLAFPWASTIMAATIVLAGVILLVYMIIECICYKPNQAADETSSTGDPEDDQVLLTA